MRIVKLNILHLHMTDSESFPFEIEKYPEITHYGSYGKNFIYSLKDI